MVEQDDVIERVGSQKHIIQKIFDSQENNYRSIEDPEAFIMEVKGIESALKSGIENLKTISSNAKEVRSQLQDAYINRNFTSKSEQFDEFQTKVVNLKEKLENIQTKVENEKEDPQLDEYHKQNLEDIEEILSRREPELTLLENKSEEDQKLINMITEKIETVGDLSQAPNLEEL